MPENQGRGAAHEPSKHPCCVGSRPPPGGGTPCLLTATQRLTPQGMGLTVSSCPHTPRPPHSGAGVLSGRSGIWRAKSEQLQSQLPPGPAAGALSTFARAEPHPPLRNGRPPPGRLHQAASTRLLSAAQRGLPLTLISPQVPHLWRGLPGHPAPSSPSHHSPAHPRVSVNSQHATGLRWLS